MAKPKKNTHRVVTFLSDEEWNVLRRIHQETLAPVSALVRKAVQKFVEGNRSKK